MPQIGGDKGEAVVNYAEPLARLEMGYQRFLPFVYAQLGSKKDFSIVSYETKSTVNPIPQPNQANR